MTKDMKTFTAQLNIYLAITLWFPTAIIINENQNLPISFFVAKEGLSNFAC